MTCTADRHHDYNAARQYGCTCPTAHAAYMRYGRMAKRRARASARPLTTDPTGTARRIQALAAIGWSLRAIGKAAGMAHININAIAQNRRAFVRTDNADIIAAVYERLYLEDGPSKHQRHVARRHGWVGPEYWSDETIDDPTAEPSLGPADVEVDELAVELVAARIGKPLRPDDRSRVAGLTDAELETVLVRLRDRGHPCGLIGELVGLTANAVAYRYSRAKRVAA